MKPFKCINAQPRKDRLPLNRFATFATAGTSHRLDRAWEDVHSRPWSTRKNGVFDQKHNKTPAEERDIFRPELFYNYINEAQE